MRVSTIPYNFQSSNFEHVNKQYSNISYTKTNIYKFPKDRSRNATDGSSFSSTSRAGDDISVGGNIYATSHGSGLICTRVGTYEATGVVRIGPELDGSDQTKLDDTVIKNNSNFTSTWLSGVVGIMYKYAAIGSHGEVNSGRVKKIGLCYLNPSNGKIITYNANHMITGLPFGDEPEDNSKVYPSAVMLDTSAKNAVINNNYKYVGLVMRHFHRHTTGNVTLTCRFYNVRPIISYSTDAWNVVKDKLTVNGNASGKKIIVPHPSTTRADYYGGDYRIHTF